MNVCQWDIFEGIFLRGRCGKCSKKGKSASNCRETENVFLSPSRKKSVSARCFLKAGLISRACTVEFI